MSSHDRRTFLKAAAGTAAVIAIEPHLLALPARLAAPVQVGVVGVGRQGRAILGELAKFEDVRVAALCDVDKDRLAAGLRRAAGAAGFEDHRKMLDTAKDLDAVVVATPTHQHREAVADALAKGKHVFCEAPLAHTLEDARAIVRAARGAGTVFQPSLQARSDPIYQLARSFFRAGAIRDVVSMRAVHRRKNSWRTPSPDPSQDKARNWKLDPEVSLGLVGEIGTHQLDALQWMMDRYPEAVTARGEVLAWRDDRKVADTVHCDFTFPGGVRLGYEATLANSYEGQYELLIGTMGSIKLAWTHGWLFKEADAPTQGWEVYAIREQFHGDEGISLIADATKLAEQGKLREGVGLPNPPLYYSLADFLKSVTEKKPVVCTAEEGLRSTAIAIFAHQALTSGTSVAIDPKDLQVEER